MISKNAIMYNKFILDMIKLEIIYNDVSREIKALLDRAREQAKMELRKEENGRK